MLAGCWLLYEVRFTPLGSDGFSKKQEKRRKKEKKTTQHRTNTVHELFTKPLLYTHQFNQLVHYHFIYIVTPPSSSLAKGASAGTCAGGPSKINFAPSFLLFPNSVATKSRRIPDERPPFLPARNSFPPSKEGSLALHTDHTLLLMSPISVLLMVSTNYQLHLPTHNRTNWHPS